MLMKNEVVEMVVRVMDSAEFNETYCEEQITYMDASFDSITGMLEYNEAFHVIEELNNYHPYNAYDVVYINDSEMFVLVLEQY